MRDSNRPKDPTPDLWIDFNRVVGSNMLKLDDFISSTEMKLPVDFDVVDAALVRSARHPPQPRSDVRMKPQMSGQDSFIFIFEDFKYVD